MSGLVGSITSASKEFNDIGTKSTIEGIKIANFLNGKIATAEKEKIDESLKNNYGQEKLATSDLVEGIIQDMEDDKER